MKRIVLVLFLLLLSATVFAAYPTVTHHTRLYPYTSIMAAPYSCDPTGVLDCTSTLQQIFTNQSNVGTVYIPHGLFRIGANLTIPIGVTLQFEKGAVFSIDNGVTLTVYGTINAELYKIFTYIGTGKVVGLKVSYPEWFGTNTGPGVTNMSTAIQAAGTALDTGGTLKFLSSYYQIASKISISNSNITVDFGSATIINDVKLANETVYSETCCALFNFTGSNLTLKGGYWHNIKSEGIRVTGVFVGGATAGTPYAEAGYIQNITIKDMLFDNVDYTPVKVRFATGVKISGIKSRNQAAFSIATGRLENVAVKYATDAIIDGCILENLDRGGAYHFEFVKAGQIVNCVANTITNSSSKQSCCAYYVSDCLGVLVNNNYCNLTDGGVCFKGVTNSAYVASNIDVKNNNFIGYTTVQADTYGGIYMEGVATFNIVGNTVSYCGTPGIRLEFSATSVNCLNGFVANNKVYTTALAGASCFGNGLQFISTGVSSTWGRVAIKNNEFYKGNIFVQQAYDSEISGNTLYTTTDYTHAFTATTPAGIQTKDCSNCKILGNSIISTDTTAEPKIGISQLGGVSIETRNNNVSFGYVSPPIVGSIGYYYTAGATGLYPIWSGNTTRYAETAYSGAWTDKAKGSLTLTANAASTVVTDAAATANSRILITPTSAGAAADFGSATGVYVSDKSTPGQFTVTHPNNATASKTCDYLIENPN